MPLYPGGGQSLPNIYIANGYKTPDKDMGILSAFAALGIGASVILINAGGANTRIVLASMGLSVANAGEYHIRYTTGTVIIPIKLPANQMIWLDWVTFPFVTGLANTGIQIFNNTGVATSFAATYSGLYYNTVSNVWGYLT